MSKLKSITFQNGQGDEEHNRREEKATDKKKHIDKSRSDLNIKYIDRNIEEVYTELFGESCEEYNAKARKNRRIENYYEKIKNDGKKKVSYECIVQIGKKEDTSYNSELEKKALDQFFREWEKRNPNLFVYCAYMHNDEGTSHLHIDYIPVARDCTRGLRVQNSLTKALQQQGFRGTGITNTEQIQWENSERLALEKICQELGINAEANQGLCKTKYYDEKTETFKVRTRKHLSTTEFKRMNDELRNELLLEVQQEKLELQSKVDELKKKTTMAEKELSNIEKQKIQINEELQPLKQEKENLVGNIAKLKAIDNKLNKDIIRKTNALNIPKVEVPEVPETVVVKGAFGKEKTRKLTPEERTIREQEKANAIKQNELSEQLNLLLGFQLMLQAQEEEQRAKLKKQNAELEQITNEISTANETKNNLQREIVDLQNRKDEFTENIVNNVRNNLEELKIYHEQEQIFRKIFQKHYEISENKPIESEEKYENTNVKNSYDFEL